jgi:hypothetical protein
MACAIGGGFCRSVKPVVGAEADVTYVLGNSSSFRFGGFGSADDRISIGGRQIRG